MMVADEAGRAGGESRDAAPGTAPDAAIAARATRKIVWRIGGLLALAALLQGLDRLNIAYAGIALRRDLGFTASQFGTGAGIFFLSYVAFGLPANLMLMRLGARRWLTIMMVAWGLASAGMAFAVGPISFYLLRLLLGAAEAGFAPAMLYLVSLWVPAAVRGRTLAMLLAMSPISAVIGGPISAMLLSAHGAFGLAGWQLLFIIEGIPTVLLAGIMWLLMSDGPDKADWLDAEERASILRAQPSGPSSRAGAEAARGAVLRAALDPRTLALGFVILTLAMLGFSLMFFLPQIIQSLGYADTLSVLLAAIPPAMGILFMLVWGRLSDRRSERLWHCISAMACAIAGTLVVAFATDPVVGLVALAISVGGAYAAHPLAWALVQQVLRGESSAVAIAIIHSIANIAGFIGPVLMGLSKDMTGSFGMGLAGGAAMGMAGIAVLLWMFRAGVPGQEGGGAR